MRPQPMDDADGRRLASSHLCAEITYLHWGGEAEAVVLCRTPVANSENGGQLRGTTHT